MSGRGLRPVSGLVDRLLRGLGIAGDVDRAGAIEAWRPAITAVLGPDAAETRALDVDGTTLVVAVPSPAWAAEVRLRSGDILDALRSAAPRSGIRAIRTIPVSGRPPRPRSGAGPTTSP